jgi:hypothetical protein
MIKKTNVIAQKSKTKATKNNSRKNPTGQNGGFRILRVKKGDSLKKIYAKVRKAFTAADLQKYTEIEEGIPFDKIIAEIDLTNTNGKRKERSNLRNSYVPIDEWRAVLSSSRF